MFAVVINRANDSSSHQIILWLNPDPIKRPVSLPVLSYPVKSFPFILFLLAWRLYAGPTVIIQPFHRRLRRIFRVFYSFSILFYSFYPFSVLHVLRTRLLYLITSLVGPDGLENYLFYTLITSQIHQHLPYSSSKTRYSKKDWGTSLFNVMVHTRAVLRFAFKSGERLTIVNINVVMPSLYSQHARRMSSA